MQHLIIAVIVCLYTLPVRAGIKLPKLFADGMVLQRDTPIVLWGWADANEPIKVQFKNKTYTTQSDEKGDWKITLPAQKAGGPHSIQINEITLKNILTGDVWLCSGQSNMELQLRRVMDLYRDEILKINNPSIRYCKTPYNYNYKGESCDMPDGTKWVSATPEHTMEFSATAYFFAAALYEKTGIPIGIINSSVGGTPIEQWISSESIYQFPEYVRKSAADWASITLPGYWRDKGIDLEEGVIWLRKHIDIPKALAGKAAQLRLGCIVNSDSTFVNGRFVGNVTYQYPPRIYPLQAGLLQEGKNTISIRVVSSGRGGFVEEKPYKIIIPPVPQPWMNLGGITGDEIDLTGEWQYKIERQDKPEDYSTAVTALYNGMIAPTLHIPFRGVIWYQGESNIWNRHRYAALLTALIADWRTKFNNPRLPFYIVELADFMKDNREWHEMQQIQRQAVSQNADTYFIPNADLGEWNDIHPLSKKPLGERIAECVWNNMNK